MLTTRKSCNRQGRTTVLAVTGMEKSIKRGTQTPYVIKISYFLTIKIWRIYFKLRKSPGRNVGDKAESSFTIGPSGSLWSPCVCTIRPSWKIFNGEMYLIPIICPLCFLWCCSQSAGNWPWKLDEILLCCTV